jgi:hypothetical protein
MDVTRTELEGLAAQDAALKVLKGLPVGDALGAACSFMLQCSFTERAMFRRVMNERVIRDGFRGISLLEQFKRASR